jgi:hypothetical protein
MQSTIYLHIGLHKTGTSSIQTTLSNNRKKLLAHGINYADLGDDPNHSVVLLPLFRKAPHRYRLNRRVGIDSKEKAAKKNAASLAALRRALKSNKSGSIVFSGEGIAALPAHRLRRLQAELEPYAVRFRVIAYVRDPYSAANSMVQQRVRRGQTYEEIAATPPYLRYSRIEASIEVFGRENVDIRMFDPAHFVDGDLIADFLAAIGAAPELAKKLEVARTNVGLSHEAAYLMHEINKHSPRDEKVAPDLIVRPELIKWLEQIPGQPYRCPPELLKAARPLIARELKWLRDVLGKRVFPDRPTFSEVPPRWGEETVTALALVLNELAKRDARKGGLEGIADRLRRLTRASR